MSQLSMEDRDDYAELAKFADKVLPKLHADIWSWFYCDNYTYAECAKLAGRSVSWIQRSLRMTRPVVLAEAAEAEKAKTDGKLRHGHTIHFGAEATFANDETEKEAITAADGDMIDRYIFGYDMKERT